MLLQHSTQGIPRPSVVGGCQVIQRNRSFAFPHLASVVAPGIARTTLSREVGKMLAAGNPTTQVRPSIAAREQQI